MVVRPMLALAVLLLLHAGAPTPTASLPPSARLNEGVKFFDAADYAKARDNLAPIVDSPGLNDSERAKARMFLAASYHALGDVQSARAQLQQLARTAPHTRLDPGLF